MFQESRFNKQESLINSLRSQPLIVVLRINESDFIDNFLNKKLISEIENLFIVNSKNLLNNEYDEFEQIGSGTYHNSNELPIILKSALTVIFSVINEISRVL